MSMAINQYGEPFIPATPVADMSHPVQCAWCWTVHDAGTVTVIQRYADCSVWKCPACGVKIDDRPKSMGGTALPVPRQNKEDDDA